jgi:hypothetical protein
MVFRFVFRAFTINFAELVSLCPDVYQIMYFKSGFRNRWNFTGLIPEFSNDLNHIVLLKSTQDRRKAASGGLLFTRYALRKGSEGVAPS